MTDENRRYEDSHATPCKALNAHADTVELIFKDIQEMKKTQTKMVEMLQAWDNTKGFVATIKSMGVILLWLVGIGAAISVMSEGVRHWIFQR